MTTFTGFVFAYAWILDTRSVFSFGSLSSKLNPDIIMISISLLWFIWFPLHKYKENAVESVFIIQQNDREALQ